METSTRLHDVEEISAGRDTRVDAYFDTLRREQVRFLDAIGRARSLLGDDAAQLVHASAVQGRLTRQFFDAQRAILQRRADVDAQVARILAATDWEAAGPDLPSTPSTYRQEIAALGVSLVRTAEDAEALSPVLAEAFHPGDPDGAAAEAQLSAMLHDWWQAENAESRIALDDAHARAALCRHIARIEAGAVVDAGVVASATGPDAATTDHLPAQVSSTLATADSARLQLLMAWLCETVDALPAEPAIAEPLPVADGVVIRLDGTPNMPVEDPFRKFWIEGEPPAPRRFGRLWNPLRLATPMTAATACLALFVAWVG